MKQLQNCKHMNDDGVCEICSDGYGLVNNMCVIGYKNNCFLFNSNQNSQFIYCTLC